jgi:hypothetical protein
VSFIEVHSNVLAPSWIREHSDFEVFCMRIPVFVYRHTSEIARKIIVMKLSVRGHPIFNLQSNLC